MVWFLVPVVLFCTAIGVFALATLRSIGNYDMQMPDIEDIV